ncbi:serine hydrolase domain-containing protein [Sandaracinomonas limnophila]|uniref:serine hydrolase domain-containing protein n=1 Tax=Sandaracinomonas limnophila TaxID=1862386 RepID=UPI0013E40C31|nr:serine hydrolase domain-containing protein [Sandaracinomonas limnophila]
MKKSLLLLPFAILITIVSCSHQSGHFWEGSSEAEKRNDSIASLFDPQLAQQKAIKLDTFFQKLHKNYGFNGAVLVSQYGKIIYKKAFGYSNYFTKTALQAQTHFQLASVSKQFTAVAVMQLKEKGLLNYDDPVKKYIPNFPYDSVITVRSLLTHRSGLPNYAYALDKYYNKKLPLNNQMVVDLFAKFKPGIDYRPNAKFAYNNTNYLYLAAIVEKLTGQNFRQYVKENIFEPAEMAHSFIYDPAHPEQLKTAAIGYLPRRGAPAVAGFDHLDGVTGDKGIYSTVEDMHHWDMALNQEKLVKRSTLEEAFTPQHREPKVLPKNYGFGWRLTQLENGEWLTYHTGWWHGFKNYYLHNPKDNSAIIILGNMAGHSLAKVNIVQSILYPEKASIFMKGEPLPQEFTQGGN